MVFNPELLYADRIGGRNFGKPGTKKYKFQVIKDAKQAWQTANPDGELLDFGVGEHDGFAPESSIDALIKEVRDPRNRRYTDNGPEDVQQTIVKYANRMLGLNLPTGKEAANWFIHGAGSKPVLAYLPTAFVNPGDGVVMTVPGYPVFGTNAAYLEGKVINLPLYEKNKFLPDLNDADGVIEAFNRNNSSKGNRVKAFVINYPNNPTGAGAPLEFLDNLAELAIRHNFIVVHDAAYMGWSFNGTPPQTILNAKGGLECGILVPSASKAFNGIPWRFGGALGNPRLVAAYGNVKDNKDSGQSPFVQRAIAKAFEDPSFSEVLGRKYGRRLEGLVGTLNSHGFDAKMPDGTFFLYTKAPKGIKGEPNKFVTAQDSSTYMLSKQGILTVPWDDAGQYVRWSVAFSDGKAHNLVEGDPVAEKRILGELNSRLGKLELTFN